MKRLTKFQREKVSKFVRLTGSNDAEAIRALENHNWNVQVSADLYRKQKEYWELGEREKLFRRFKDPHVDMILADGIEHLCREIQVDPQDIVMLVLSWHMRAATMCEFSRNEFVRGLTELGFSTMETFREAVPYMREELKDDDIFSDVYNFAFDWATEKGQKSLSLDTSIAMWKLLFTERKWPFIDHWCEFIRTHHKKSISRDTWTMLLEFVNRVDPTLENYNAEDAWPYLMDGFVEYIRERGLASSGGGDLQVGTQAGCSSSACPSSSSNP